MLARLRRYLQSLDRGTNGKKLDNPNQPLCETVSQSTAGETSYVQFKHLTDDVPAAELWRRSKGGHQQFNGLLIKPFKPLKFIIRSHNSCIGLVFAARDCEPMPNSEIVTKSHNRCNRR